MVRSGVIRRSIERVADGALWPCGHTPSGCVFFVFSLPAHE